MWRLMRGGREGIGDRRWATRRGEERRTGGGGGAARGFPLGHCPPPARLLTTKFGNICVRKEDWIKAKSEAEIEFGNKVGIG
uniref:Uncharacterized protein n=1 Tax=Oryza sativa subsp. japonica TaxID=39947 RepID=Q8H461_ORYSJ|nr:hypothetical protein [Oryza sativa Japonica Group]